MCLVTVPEGLFKAGVPNLNNQKLIKLKKINFFLRQLYGRQCQAVPCVRSSGAVVNGVLFKDLPVLLL